MMVSDVGRTTSGSSSAEVGSTAVASFPCLPVALRRVWVTTATSFANPSTCSASFARKLIGMRSEEHTSELQSQSNLVCRLLLEKKKKRQTDNDDHTSSEQHSLRCARLRP